MADIAANLKTVREKIAAASAKRLPVGEIIFFQ